MPFTGIRYICYKYKTCQAPCYKKRPFYAWLITRYMKCGYTKIPQHTKPKKIELLNITNIQWEIYKAFKKVKRANRKKI
jgi:hypothetical protein